MTSVLTSWTFRIMSMWYVSTVPFIQMVFLLIFALKFNIFSLSCQLLSWWLATFKYVSLLYIQMYLNSLAPFWLMYHWYNRVTIFFFCKSDSSLNLYIMMSMYRPSWSLFFYIVTWGHLYWRWNEPIVTIHSTHSISSVRHLSILSCVFLSSCSGHYLRIL
jgi:hypothetical protein